MRYSASPMSRHWLLPPAAAHSRSVALTDVARLLERLGGAASDGVAEALLQLLGREVALAQCAIFSFQGQGRPQVIGLGDRARTATLAAISQDYAQRFYLLDGSQRVLADELEWVRAQRSLPATLLTQARIWLHLQSRGEVDHPEYRAVCYEQPQVVERLSLLSRQQNARWLSVNLYRGEEHGPFDAAAITVIEAFAPLVIDLLRLHYAGQTLQDDLAGWVIARLHKRFGQLTQRDLDVVRGVLEGLDTPALAQRLGLTLESARTYLKRLCRKLGVQGQRELFALLMEPGEREARRP